VTLAHKKILLSLLVAELERALAVTTQAVHTAREAATHPDAKPENDKDTRGLEAGYLASGQSMRAAELQRDVVAAQQLAAKAINGKGPIALLAHVVLRDNDTDVTQDVLLAPLGGGIKLQHQTKTIQVMTPQSPLGAALIGKHVGDDIDIRIGSKTRSLHVVSVR
jgi:transcription elongation GreA/GreB family factor